MKILELRFKNLNSLYGEWMIDFTDPEYVVGGIFALTGPTGAGKSTILDAICLALYGATPRLGKITKSANEIMSSQTGECYAELLFESQVGRFRCHWEQRRARKKAEGHLQDQQHQIADEATGKLIETKKSLVVGVIEAKTGMDFDRFTRSILLAQGGFDTFLNADIEQKSKILEQITGTKIYSDISRRVHERQRDEREKLNILNAEASGIVILEREQEREIQNDLSVKQKQETDLVGQSTEVSTAITWLVTTRDLEKEMLSLEGDAEQLKADVEAFKPKRAKLEQADKAASLEGTYAIRTALRQQREEDQAELNQIETQLPELHADANTQHETLAAAEQYTEKTKKTLHSEAPLIQKIRALDQRILEQEKATSEVADIYAKEKATMDTDKQAQNAELDKLTAAEKVFEDTQRYLKENGQDEWLISGLAGIAQQFDHLLTKQQEITRRETDLNNADKAVGDVSKKLAFATEHVSVNIQKLEKVGKRLYQCKNDLSELLKGRLLREYRTKKDNLLREITLIKKIYQLEDHRAELKDGKPCPLCGSAQHPFAEGNVPVPDDLELEVKCLNNRIVKAEAQQDNIKKLEQAEMAARNLVNDSEKQMSHAVNDEKMAQKSLEDLKHICLALRGSFKDIKHVVSKKLQPLGITEIPESEVATLLSTLKSRQRMWLEQAKQRVDTEKQMVFIEGEVKRLGAVIDARVTALTAKQQHLQRLKKEHGTDAENRKQWYVDKDPDDEEARLSKAITDAEVAEKKASDLHTKLQQSLITATTHVASLKNRIKQRAFELKTAEENFFTQLTATGFVDEDVFRMARLPPEERESLHHRAQALDNARTAFTAKQKDRGMRLAAERAKNLTDQTLDALEPLFKAQKESLNRLRDAIAGLQHKMNENTAAKARIKARQTAIETQQKECDRWMKLHHLIGSADGKKYRNFAQGLTFELMVSHANRQLEKMTDRYLLIRDEQQPLALNVVDNYQAGETRSTKNLSGGESFIVSLTLALGLSKMSSRKVRVDSLFLDEGFGTLDEEALETALETLSGLQQDGKLIGIISHVSALKERIGTQINIIPISGGRSTLSGPGCTKVVKSE